MHFNSEACGNIHVLDYARARIIMDVEKDWCLSTHTVSWMNP